QAADVPFGWRIDGAHWGTQLGAQVTLSSPADAIVSTHRPASRSVAGSGDKAMTAKRIIIIGLLTLVALAFLAVLGLAVLREAPGTNSYALMADGWLHGRLDVVGKCFDADCAGFNGQNFVIFPPVPGVIALPFVALFGVDFHHFVPLTILAFALTGYLWFRIAAAQTAGSRDLTTLIVMLILFASPLFFVTLRGDHVWFYAQSWGFLFSTAALYFAMIRKNAVLTGLFIGLAFLSRQMTILYVPFLYVMLLDEGTPWFRIDGKAILRAARLMAFPIIAVAIYFAYNDLRFGSPLETGYAYIFPYATDHGPTAGFIAHRVQDIGIFSRSYLLFNFIYMFIAGPHVQFTNQYLTQMGGFDANGASIFLVTPALLFAFLGRWDRAFWFGLATCAVILGLTLFYHSNGYSQYSAQRYALDWLPVLMIFVARGVKTELAPPLSLMMVYSMGVTLSMIVIGGLVTTTPL
ncbi:MAG: hypothetical protein ABI377_02565, partial [Devosia sp.]